VTFGSSKVKGSEKRVISNTAYANISSQYTSTSFGGEGYVGANVVLMDNVSVTPMVGFRYTKITDSSYKESGNTPQLLNVYKKSTDKAEGVVGVRVAGGAFNMGPAAATPEVHAFLSNDFIGKDASVTMKYDDSPNALNPKAGKSNKTYGNIGASLNAEQGVMEYGIGYDLTLARKYVGHQGTLKLRVNF
jgi:outer membrane autotransporter protein